MSNRVTISRRDFFPLATLGLSLATPAGRLAFAQAAASAKTGGQVDADEALRQLLDGNKRFISGQTTAPRRNPESFTSLAAGQYPEAIIVSCADSRVAPEILFDVGIGDIFVIRVAGNVVRNSGVVVRGSIEYAVAELKVPLIMVLGHSACGAVKAAKQHIDAKDSLPGAIDGLVELIKPAVTQSASEPGDNLENAIRKNVKIGVNKMKQSEPILAPQSKDGKLNIGGAVYDLSTGAVKMV